MVPIMTMLARLGTHRAAIAVLAAITGLYMALVVFNNITDFKTNKDFVVHVLAMDTTFQTPGTMWRAITGEGWAVAAYIAIIVWETLTAIALITSVIAWIRNPGGWARRLTSLGLLMMITLFGLGFIVIGGEWFQMWQSKNWNGVEAAFRNLVIAALALVVTYLPQPQRTT
jgi:predicted small integral membrane protein